MESPGRIADSDLGTKDAIPGMVIGMKYDLSQATDAMQEFLALAAVELWHGGSYDWGDVPRGVILEEDVGGSWNSPQQARWVAETGVERIRELLDRGGVRQEFPGRDRLYLRWVRQSDARRQLLFERHRRWS